MAKEGSNPMQGYHRQKRQKEVKKNKSQRIKGRDERVIQTKTVAEVQDEIRNIKKRKNLQASELQKLQRLEKELKLVKEAADARPKEPLSLPSEQQTKPLTELDDPRKSVYYDERLNPYGAPPPGKPRLYHQRGGGVTMDIRYAAVPGEEPPPPPPPPRSAAHGVPGGARPGPRDSSRSQYVTKRQVENTTGRRDEGFRMEESSLRRQHVGASSQQTTLAEQTADKAREEDAKPLVTPNLPAPSNAVLRSRRGNASVDVWASTEEVEYERLANHVDLEADDVGATALKKTKPKTNKPPLEIYYQDRAGQIQGPFPKAQMLAWMAASFFPPTTMVKTNRNDTWIPIDNLPALRIDCPAPTQKDSVEDRIAALKHADSVEDRIAALRTESCAPKGDRNNELPGLQDDSRNIPALPPPPELPQDPPLYVVDNKLGTYASVNPDSPPPYPTVDDCNDGQPQYSDEDDGDDGLAIAPYPQMDEELPAYPVDEDIAYPMDMAYPIAEGDDDAACYPVTEPYHALDQPQGDDGEDNLPQSGNFDGDGVAPIYPMHVPASAEPVKIVKVDKELLTFLPSHLQSRKRKAAGGQSLTKPSKKVNSHSASTYKAPTDEMDKYLEEIESLDG